MYIHILQFGISRIDWVLSSAAASGGFAGWISVTSQRYRTDCLWILDRALSKGGKDLPFFPEVVPLSGRVHIRPVPRGHRYAGVGVGTRPKEKPG